MRTKQCNTELMNATTMQLYAECLAPFTCLVLWIHCRSHSRGSVVNMADLRSATQHHHRMHFKYKKTYCTQSSVLRLALPSGHCSKIVPRHMCRCARYNYDSTSVLQQFDCHSTSTWQSVNMQ